MFSCHLDKVGDKVGDDHVDNPNRYQNIDPAFLDPNEVFRSTNNRSGDDVNTSTETLFSNADKSQIKDASRDLLISLFLTPEEIKAYEARKQMCWESEDPIKCKEELDQEYAEIIEKRQGPPKLPDLTLEVYKAAISALTFFLQQFALHAGLPEIVIKLSQEDNATWIRIPQRIVVITDLLREATEKKAVTTRKKKIRNENSNMPFEIYTDDKEE